ncbi:MULTISPECIES: hypothetical protein [unclassified Aureispira]|uniref:hypothetical protein n=1 Tax=unclassified Aureispira TaxID=2649989 RepID=UPI0006990DD1|nr:MULTISPECIES: hypothetical protein [unclassified Aureispira]WMX14351.1 hypothetical protein QP953_26195 [Aureispira sp. CCB-E]
MTGAYQFLKKYGVAIGFGTGTILAVLTYAIILGGFPEFTPSKKELYNLGIFNFGLYTTYALIIVACALVVLFSIINVAKNPKGSIKGVAGFAVLVVIFFITYSMGDGLLTEQLAKSDPMLIPMETKQVGNTMVKMPVALQEGVTTSPELKTADGLIKFSYVMMLLAIVAMIFAALRDLVKQS